MSGLWCLRCGVPQGFVLGSLSYVLHASPIADVIKQHNLHYHFYADDIQMYVAFETNSYEDLRSVKSRVDARGTDCWMINNGLKLNQDKTKITVINRTFARWCHLTTTTRILQFVVQMQIRAIVI